jgi:NAD+ synthase
MKQERENRLTSQSLADEISHWIGLQVEMAGAKGAVVGMSGGLDSSLTAILCKRALADEVQGLILPCHSDPADEKHARLVARRFGIRVDKIDLGPVFDILVTTLPRDGQVPVANVKPRLRMIALYYYANRLDYLVVGSGNKSELMTGYFTKYGDGGVDILPLGGLLKTGVRELARELGVPAEIVKKPPSAGLWVGQTDEGELGITYEELDRTLRALDSPRAEQAQREVVTIVKEMVSKSHHKRAPIPIYEPGL